MDPSEAPHADADSPEPESYEDEPADDDDEDASSAAANPVGTATEEEDENEPTVFSSVRTLQSLSHLRDISDAAVAWQVSSAKPGNGVEQLRDPATDSYWQSDGTTQPHYIQIHFHRRLAVTHVALYLDYQLDESYTPKTIRVETGMTSQDLTCAAPQNQSMELHEPAGWVIFPVYSSLDHAPHDQSFHNSSSTNQQYSTSKAHLLRISILSMHQNGRDTHVRRVALFAERAPTVPPAPALPVKRKTAADHEARGEEDDDDNENDDDVSYTTRGLTSGFSSLGMQSPFATTIR